MEITNQSSLETTYTDPDTTEDVTETKTSNTVSATNLTESITSTKTFAKVSVKRDEEVSQDNNFVNGTTYTLTGVTYTETLSEGASFVAGTVEINGEPDGNANPVEGITLSDLNPSDELLLTFKVKTAEGSTETHYTSQGTLAFTTEEEGYTVTTNVVTVNVVENLVVLTLEADKTIVVKGNTIHYTINIANSGTYENKNLTFTNPMPEGTTFVSESVKIDDEPDTSLDPATGFSVKDLAPEDSVKIEFDVTVN